MAECELCKLVNQRNIVTVKHYEDSQFIMVDCKTCHTPMLVSKHHAADIDDIDKEMAYHLFYKHAQRVDISKWYVDYEMRSIKDHWHCHLRRI